MFPNRPISHIGYAVTDIEAAAAQWASLLGAGPFVLVERMVFDEVLHDGKPAVFDHSAAFGQWGSIIVELQQVFASAPVGVTERLLPGGTPTINHVSYVSATAEEDSAELTARGFELFLYAKFGDVEVRWHDTRAQLGQAIEIHKKGEFIDEFFADVQRQSVGWNGERPLRDWAQ